MDEELTLSEIYGEDMKFKYTLEGWVLPKYDKFYSKEYKVNYLYIEDHLDELLKLSDVITPKLNLIGGYRQKWNKRHATDVGYDTPTGEHGIYAWYMFFCRAYSRSVEMAFEDDCRMALDIARKYPEHAAIIQKKTKGD